MVDGRDTTEAATPAASPTGAADDTADAAVLPNGENVAKESPPTTTISTIAVQSGETCLVIALLQSGKWLRLKVLEVQPELTKLGASVEEATELSAAHNEVLLRLQGKQSPVEELLRQADQLISTQKPRAEVYAAMAETLGQAWRDVNDLLERRKQILDSNVLFQCRAEECGERMKALEMACNDTLLPIEIDAVKNFLSKIHDLRKAMLEALMGALQEGKTLLDKLKEIASEGTLDSRPERIKVEADHAVLTVERWLEDLHDRRRVIEASFRNRKTQLEQCLALALLATDLRDLEEILNDRIAALSNSCDQLGDSASSAQLLLFELKKLQTEAKEFQDRSIKITKSTERLVSSGHFAGEQATEQAYAILGAAADYVNDLEQYETLLNRAVAFFEAARSAVTKLDQLEIQLATTEHPPFSARLAHFHAQTAATIEDVTEKPLAEGYTLLNVTGRGVPGAEGVRRTVEDLENHKIRLMKRCTAHEEESLQISQAISVFLEKHEQLRSWLVNIAEAFLQGHQDMGSDLPMAEDFYRLHDQLLNDLDERTNELEHLEFEILPIRERLDELQRREFQGKILKLQESWTKTRSIVARRLELGSLYLKFHHVVEELKNGIELLENELKSHTDESRVEYLKEKWKYLQTLYLKLSESGKAFLDEAERMDDPYLDVPRACLCVQTILESLSNRQLTITESWEKWQTTIEIFRERRIERQRKLEESTRTLEWVSKFSEQLYPIITAQSLQLSSLLYELEAAKHRILPELKKAVDELAIRLKNIRSNTVDRDEISLDEEVSRKLTQMHEKLHNTARDYEDLLMSLTSIFQKLEEVERKITETKIRVDHLTSFTKLSDINTIANEWESSRRIIADSLEHLQFEIERTISKIRRQESPDAASSDIEKLTSVVNKTTSLFQSFASETMTRIEEQKKICVFGEDLTKIDSDIQDLNQQLLGIDAKFHENLQAAKAAHIAFDRFEKTITILEERIEKFVRNTEINVCITSAPYVKSDLASLNKRLEDLKVRMDETRKRLALCIEYFELLEEAKEWNREGGKLLIILARKTTAVKTPVDATSLLEEIEVYLRPGEQKQERRIEKLKELSTIVFGTERLPQFNELIVENRQTLDSFAVVSSELRSLAQNLLNAEDLREKLRLEKLEADEKLHAVKREMVAAEVAREEAENARRAAEKLAAETLERASVEAERLKKESLEKMRLEEKIETQSLLSSPAPMVHEEKSERIENIDKRFVHETITSAVTKKEIQILQKVEVEKIVPIVQKEQSPMKETVTTTNASQQTEQQDAFVAQSPEFTVPLNDAIVQEGEKFSFECRLIGYPVPEVVWYKDGISILNNPDYLTVFHQGTCTLTIEETFTEDSARFTCKAFNYLGSAETSALLTVKETAPEEQASPPIFVKELQPSTANEASSHRLECTVKGNPLPTVQWYKNEINIDNSPDYVITYNNGEACVIFEQVFFDDQATYTCKATNRLGQASTSALLRVEPTESSTEKPYFVTPLSNAMARTGQRVKLECEAAGTPIPRLVWLHDGKIVEETSHLKIQTDDGRTSLIISEAFPKDAGCYTVTATNEVAEASVSCNVSVKGRLPHESDSELACSDIEPSEPKIQLPLRDLEVIEGSTARLDCVIVGQPEPEVIWYRNDKPVKESADFQLLFQGDKCSLLIHEAFLDDAGLYKVVAINSGGEASSQCTLTVQPALIQLPKQEDEMKQQVVEPATVPTGSPPKFIKLPTDSLVAEGEDAVFECIVTGEPKPEIKWYSDSGEIKENERILIKQKEDGTGVLKFVSAVPKDKGNYVVKAVNSCGEAKAFARLVVRSLSDFHRKEEFVQMEEKLIAPIFKERFSDKRVVEGAPIKFECIVAGKPAPKIQWLFNDRPVHGKDFLVSVSGDRQVLTIPETSRSHVGAISCLAENAAGRAHCTAKVEIDIEATRVEGTEEGTTVEIARLLPEQDEMHASSSSEKHFSTEKTSEGDGASQILTKMSSTVTESSTTHTSTKKEYISSTTSSTLAKSGEEPLTISMKTTIHSTEKSASENGAPPVVQSEKVEEYEKIVQDRPGEIRQEKTVVVSQGEDGIKRDMRSGQAQKLCRKSTAPRFVSPLTGMIVDQGADVILEGIVDGYPQPSISWTKNGQEIPARDGATTSYAHNRVCLELKGVNVRNAGRYTCTATNDVGSASSTADLVVKKTIFPPVFGKRLQAQVVKRGDRVIMEVEITGTPEPTVTWYKDDVPIREQPPELRLKQLGNCYTLIIEKASKEHAGKYMVRATNAGGEAQSIADFAVFEPTPDTMTEVHKTVIYENVHDKRIVQSEEKMGEASGSDVKKEKAVKTTMQQPSFKAVSVPSSSLLTTRTALDTAAESEMKSCRSETISSTIESHKSETKSEQKFHMKLEHKTPPIPEMEPRIEQTAARKEFLREEVTLKSDEPKMATTIDERSSENENIETSTIARKDALSFFESFSKGSESAPKGPKEMIKLVEDTADGGKSTREVKVEELTKNYERSSAFQEVKTKVESKPTEYQATKKSVQDIFSKFQQGSSSRGVDNKLFEFPCEEYKSPLLKSGGTILEESSLSTFSKERTQFESTESTTGVFDLVPEPPPEIGYMPKPEQPKKKYPDVTLKAKQLQESFDKGLSPIDAPAGAVKIFPSPLPSPAAKPVEPPKFQAPKRPTSIPPPPFELETKKEEKSELRSLSPSRFYSSSSDVETRSHISTDISEYRCHSAASSHQETLRSTSPRPSADGLAMEKSWAKKCPDSSRKSWPPQTESTIPTMRKEWHIPAEEYQSSTKEVRHETKREPGGTLKTTSIESSSNIEKRSSEGFTKEEIREKVTTRAPSPPKAPIIYNAETIKVDHTVNTIQEKSTYEKYIAECDVRKTESSEKTVEELSRRWSSVPGPDLKAPALVKSIDIPSKPVEPTVVTPVLLEPGPPPEIGYVPPIVKEKERRKIEHIEKTLEMSLESQPAKIPPGAVRTIPPPPSQKKEETVKPPPPPQPPQPPQLPQSTPSFEKLEPFPFEPPLSTPKPPSSVKLPPPPMPSKFVAKGPFESDYESDFDSHLKPKWRPYESDTDEPRYRRVKPPVATQPSRPKSTEPEPLPPSKFDIPPPEFTCTKVPGPRTPPVLPKVGSPPVYVQPSAKNQPIKSPTTKKPDSPKFKVKTFQQESGYMADTDEPFQQSSSAVIQKSFGKHESSSHSESRSSSYVESKSEYFERKSYENRTVSAGAPYASVSSSPKPITPQQRTDIDKNQSMKETVYTTTDRYSQRKMETGRKIQPPPSPSKFVRSEFRESDYESDYDGRIPTLWKPRTSEMEERTFGPVKPSFASTGQTKKAMETRNIEKEQTLITPPPPPTPPTSKSSKQVLLPGSPPELAYAAPPQAQPIYYEARAGVPFHKGAIGTETKKTVRMDESTENSRRIVTVEQTSRVIKLPDKTGQYVPTPKKFVRSQTRESDYESDVDSVRIKPKWTPTDSDTEDPRYRRVQPPTFTPKKATEYSGLPVTSPFDSDGSQFLRPGSPPEFGFVSRPADVKKAANHVASRHMSDMTSAFKSKTEKFVSDIQSDLKQGKPILKHPVDAHSDGEEDTPRTYREESRVAEHGTKQIDPDTGLIYFKYDFGYEFGIVLPGEGKKTVTSTSKSIRGQRRASDIEVPIVHEFTQAKENGFSASSQGRKSTTSYSPGTAKYGPSKTVKWEPTSESEFSESEDVRSGRRRYPGGQVSGSNVNTSCAAAAPPPSLLIPCSPSPSRWDHTTPSPLSLSPSLPSLSPRYSSATGPPSNVDSAGSPWPTTNGVTSNKEVIQPYLEILPKKAPLFITPLRDIAVVSGQTARFECIVQAEPQPNILWSKDGRIIENSSNYELHYRNGVCRLTISHAFPDDAGTYACTATNSLGSTVTSATLQVPGSTLR